MDAAMVAQRHELCAELKSQPKSLLLTRSHDGVLFAGGADKGTRNDVEPCRSSDR
jgi:hypothetical protein